MHAGSGVQEYLTVWSPVAAKWLITKLWFFVTLIMDIEALR